MPVTRNDNGAFYRGRFIEYMTRYELLDVIWELGNMNIAMNQAAVMHVRSSAQNLKDEMQRIREKR